MVDSKCVRTGFSFGRLRKPPHGQARTSPLACVESPSKAGAGESAVPGVPLPASPHRVARGPRFVPPNPRYDEDSSPHSSYSADLPVSCLVGAPICRLPRPPCRSETREPRRNMRSTECHFGWPGSSGASPRIVGLWAHCVPPQPPELLKSVSARALVLCQARELGSGAWGRVKRAPSGFGLGAHCVRPQPPQNQDLTQH